jgi:hypothetical protein
MKITIDINKMNLTSKNITKVKSAIQKGIRQGLRDSGNYLVGEIRREMALPKSGNSYIFYKSKRATRDRANKRKALQFFNPSSTKTLTYPAPIGLKIPAGSTYSHTASNDSGLESSAILTGELSKSVYTKNNGSNKQIIGAKAKHASVQEDGSKNVAPRNNIRRPVSQNKTLIATKIKNAIENNLTR